MILQHLLDGLNGCNYNRHVLLCFFEMYINMATDWGFLFSAIPNFSGTEEDTEYGTSQVGASIVSGGGDGSGSQTLSASS